jgi:hypothetical protein
VMGMVFGLFVAQHQRSFHTEGAAQQLQDGKGGPKAEPSPSAPRLLGTPTAGEFFRACLMLCDRIAPPEHGRTRQVLDNTIAANIQQLAMTVGPPPTPSPGTSPAQSHKPLVRLLDLLYMRPY